MKNPINKKITYFIILFLLLMLYYFIVNLSFCEKHDYIYSAIKDFHDCDCFKRLKHGEFLKMPEKFDPLQTSFLREFYVNSKPYLQFFYDNFSPFECSCNCNYCLAHKFIYCGLFIFAMVIIFSKTGF